MLSKLLSISRYPEFLHLLWWRTAVPFFVRRAGVKIASNVEFFGRPLVSLAPKSYISLGEKVSLCSVSEYTALGVNHPVILRTLRPAARIEIGADTGISGATICAAIRVTVGSGCLFGANVVVTDTDFHALKATNRRHNDNVEDIASRPVSIGNNVFLGTGAIVLKGVVIGDNAVIGAGSIVTRDIPANSIVAGNPARVIGKIVE
ncbi:acetyltransferase-like isoleucine patch superfamily enzyme [Actimicrobium sp. GrIS 1.19]|uniref:acyltransferase n=1 Tax=Actimicrobium sp. GrIS 1.19 TaxID=3071708 RepID=UPI002E076267|nr:acetyltransferase-like isoleucine patch superfamily enzyme [Actimicrobium sp. GrIS 1.19]